MNDFDDPVFKYDCRWYFWDQMWGNIIGPYRTEGEARAALEKYYDAERWD